MREIEMDLEVIEHMGRRHTMAAEDLEDVLDTMPTSVDGGVASVTIARIISQVATNADELATISRLMGTGLTDTAADSRSADAAIATMFGTVLGSLEEGQ